MSRDVLTGELVDRSRAYLESVGVPVRVTELDPQPVDDGFFHRRIVRAVPADAHGDGAGLEPVVRLAESKVMAAKLRDAGMLDTEGYLRDDPRASDWRSALGAHAKAMGDSMRPDASGLSEVLNVAYASHELSADGFDGDMKWLEDQRKARVAAGERRGERSPRRGARGEKRSRRTRRPSGETTRPRPSRATPRTPRRDARAIRTDAGVMPTSRVSRETRSGGLLRLTVVLHRRVRRLRRRRRFLSVLGALPAVSCPFFAHRFGTSRPPAISSALFNTQNRQGPFLGVEHADGNPSSSAQSQSTKRCRPAFRFPTSALQSPTSAA